jgi:hypothetical protein
MLFYNKKGGQAKNREGIWPAPSFSAARSPTQISKDTDQIATVSREASTSSEQSALASGELAHLSVNLEKIASEFMV